MKIRDLFGIALISIGLFPVVLLIMSLSMGVMRLEFGESSETLRKVDTFLRKYSPEQDKAEVEQMNTLKALKIQKDNLSEEMSALNRERERVQNLKNENARIQANIQKDRERIEKIVSQSEELQNQRMRVLGEMFGSMRPEEAAPILLTMSDKMVSNIIRMIPESRSQSKIMGALGVIDVTRAANISQLIGRSPRT